MDFLCVICVRTEAFLYFLGCFSPYGVFCVRLVAPHVPRSGEADVWSVPPINEVWSPVELGS